MTNRPIKWRCPYTDGFTQEWTCQPSTQLREQFSYLVRITPLPLGYHQYRNVSQPVCKGSVHLPLGHMETVLSQISTAKLEHCTNMSACEYTHVLVSAA